MESHERIYSTIQALLPEEDGFECYKFRIGAYNAAVSEHFKLPYADNTYAVLVLNTPKMFEGSFKTWMQGQQEVGDGIEEIKEKVRNPIQDFMGDRINRVPKVLCDYDVEIIHDYDLTSMRRPKILMCTCGHIAGAAYYFMPKEIVSNTDQLDALFPTKPDKPIIGVSLHPKYGGHFAFRTVYIFRDVQLPNSFQESVPKNCLNEDKSEMEQLLVLFNLYWRDGRFRDCGNPEERYSQLQLDYFARPPAERWEVISHWFNGSSCS